MSATSHTNVDVFRKAAIVVGLVAGLIWLVQLGRMDVEGGGLALLALGFVVLASYTFGELVAAFGLPHLTGYLLSGVLLGSSLATFLPRALQLPPFDHGLLHPAVISQLKLLDTLAISLIALNAGMEMRVADLRRSLPFITKMVSVMALVSWPLVLAVLYGMVGPLGLVQLTGVEGDIMKVVALCSVTTTVLLATSPAVTIAVVTSTGASGPNTRLLLAAVVVLDVVIATAFSFQGIVVAPILGSVGEAPSIVAVLLGHIGGSLVVGSLAGLLLWAWLELVQEEAMLFLIGLIYTIGLICSVWHFEIILVFIAAGFVLTNGSSWWRQRRGIKDDDGSPGAMLHLVVKQLSLPTYVVFFTLTGAGIDLHVFIQSWMVAVGLFLVRAATFWFVGVVSMSGPERWLMGLSLIPQAGVAIGFAALLARTYGEDGVVLSTMVLAVIALNELTGPVILRFVLGRLGEIPGTSAAIAVPDVPLQPADRVLAVAKVQEALGEWRSEVVKQREVLVDRLRLDADAARRALFHVPSGWDAPTRQRVSDLALGAPEFLVTSERLRAMDAMIQTLEPRTKLAWRDGSKGTGFRAFLRGALVLPLVMRSRWRGWRNVPVRSLVRWTWGGSRIEIDAIVVQMAQLWVERLGNWVDSSRGLIVALTAIEPLEKPVENKEIMLLAALQGNADKLLEQHLKLVAALDDASERIDQALTTWGTFEWPLGDIPAVPPDADGDLASLDKNLRGWLEVAERRSNFDLLLITFDAAAGFAIREEATQQQMVWLKDVVAPLAELGQLLDHLVQGLDSSGALNKNTNKAALLGRAANARDEVSATLKHQEFLLSTLLSTRQRVSTDAWRTRLMSRFGVLVAQLPESMDVPLGSLKVVGAKLPPPASMGQWSPRVWAQSWLEADLLRGLDEVAREMDIRCRNLMSLNEELGRLLRVNMDVATRDLERSHGSPEELAQIFEHLIAVPVRRMRWRIAQAESEQRSESERIKTDLTAAGVRATVALYRHTNEGRVNDLTRRVLREVAAGQRMAERAGGWVPLMNQLWGEWLPSLLRIAPEDPMQRVAIPQGIRRMFEPSVVDPGEVELLTGRFASDPDVRALAEVLRFGNIRVVAIVGDGPLTREIWNRKLASTLNIGFEEVFSVVGWKKVPPQRLSVVSVSSFVREQGGGSTWDEWFEAVTASAGSPLVFWFGSSAFECFDRVQPGRSAFPAVFVVPKLGAADLGAFLSRRISLLGYELRWKVANSWPGWMAQRGGLLVPGSPQHQHRWFSYLTDRSGGNVDDALWRFIACIDGFDAEGNIVTMREEIENQSHLPRDLDDGHMILLSVLITWERCTTVELMKISGESKEMVMARLSRLVVSGLAESVGGTYCVPRDMRAMVVSSLSSRHWGLNS